MPSSVFGSAPASRCASLSTESGGSGRPKGGPAGKLASVPPSKEEWAATPERPGRPKEVRSPALDSQTLLKVFHLSRLAMDGLSPPRGVTPSSVTTQNLTLPTGMVAGDSQTPHENSDGSVGEDLIPALQLDSSPFGSKPWALCARTNIFGYNLPKQQGWEGFLCLAAISRSSDPECLTAQVFEHLQNRY